MRVFLNSIEEDDISRNMEIEEVREIGLREYGEDFSAYAFLMPCLKNNFEQGFIFIDKDSWHYDDNDQEDAGLFKFQGGEKINEKNDETWHHSYDFGIFILKIWNNDSDSESYLAQIFDKEEESYISILKTENSDEMNKFVGEILMRNRMKNE